MIARLPKSFLDYGVYALPHTVYNSTPSSAYLVRSELGQVSEDFLPISDREAFSCRFLAHFTHTPTRVHFIIILWAKLLAVRGGGPSLTTLLFVFLSLLPMGICIHGFTEV